MKPAQPAEEQLRIAIEWLRANEAVTNDGADEQSACEATATWLEDLLLDQQIQRWARKHRVPVDLARKRVHARR